MLRRASAAPAVALALTAAGAARCVSMAASYPVVEGVRTKESDVPADEAVLAAVTKSALTATRKSSKYARGEFQAGFGADVSFQTTDSAGATTELGAIGMQHTGDGGSAADIVFKTWNGADASGYAGDERGDYTRMTIHAHGGVAVPTGAPPPGLPPRRPPRARRPVRRGVAPLRLAAPARPCVC